MTEKTGKDLGPLAWNVSIVDAHSGRPSTEFQRRWETQRRNNSLFGITLGNGVPTGVPEDGEEYIDISATPFVLYVGSDGSWHQVGVVRFTDLSDVPHTYNGAGGFEVRVNPGATGLEFVRSNVNGMLGMDGQDGEDGQQGPPGPAGTGGTPGATGATGATGPQGITGLSIFGMDGYDGEDGMRGPPGPTGPSGSTSSYDKARAYLTGAASSSGAGWQKLVLNTVDYDTNTIWNVANKRFIPKQAGYYQCNIRIRANTTSIAGMVAALGFNGSQYQGVGTDIGGTGGFAVGGSCLKYCNGTTDYLEAWVFDTSAPVWTPGSFDTYMEVYGPL